MLLAGDVPVQPTDDGSSRTDPSLAGAPRRLQPFLPMDVTGTDLAAIVPNALARLPVEVTQHDDGSREWRTDGFRHRVDGPAFMAADGRQEWFLCGIRHRDDGPARIHPDGYAEWYMWGKRHRVDGPSLTFRDGYSEWRQSDLLHREDGPAVIHPNGEYEYWQHGVRHRVDGPAVVRPGHYSQWWLAGRRINRSSLRLAPGETVVTRLTPPA